VVTDAALAAPRPLIDVVEVALGAGAPAIQLRNKGESARALYDVGRVIRALTARFGTLFFVNDRLDVAMSLGADGVHLGPDDVPVRAARAVVPKGFLIGYSSDDPAEAVRAVDEGADYIGCGTVYRTSTKGNAGAAIGVGGLARVVRAVHAPVVGIGGIDERRVDEVAASGAAGVAVVGAVMAATDVAATVGRLLAPWSGSQS
jgi:thiamine-phosphate diphosphorylase